MATRHNDADIDQLLKSALASADTPDPALVRKVKYPSLKEDYTMRTSALKRPMALAAAIAAVIILSAATVFAAWYFMKPSDVAKNLGNHALSAAFESDTAVNINKSVTSGNYVFTLLAVVSGKDITDMPYYKNGEMSSDRTYAVLAVQHADGSAMDTGEERFAATPLVKGLQPWRVNAMTLGGGYSEILEGGVLYRVVECDNVTWFADRGLYFAVCTDIFINNATFGYNEQTGEISVNPNYAGASAVFDLPIDKSLADPSKAEQYLNELFPPAGESAAPPIEQDVQLIGDEQ